MRRYLPIDRLVISSATALLCWGVMEAAVAAPPSQTPLLNSDSAVAPNLVFTLDDSGSMLQAIMPELYTSLSGGGGVAMQVLTPVERSSPAGTVSNPGYTFTLLPTRNPEDEDDKVVTSWSSNTAVLWDARRRSSRYNTIYYNPEKRYVPWTRPDGTLMPYPQANSSGKWVVNLDPVLSEGTIDLSRRYGRQSGNDNDSFDEIGGTSNIVWCATITNSSGQQLTQFTEGTRCSSPGGNSSTYTMLVNSFHVASWYEFNAAGTQARRISLSAPNSATSTYDHGPDRTDCSTVISTGRRCTYSQEMRNFATWFVYYRTRLLLAKGAVAKAFASSSLPDFRLGYGALNNVASDGSSSALTVDGVSTRTLVSGVRRFTDAKSSFYNWLFGKIAYDGTPLRRAVGDVGIYFSRQGLTSAGSSPTSAAALTRLSPWADDADLGTSNYRAVSSYAGCRRAFHILTTDGYWSDGSSYQASESEARVDVESVDGSAITGTNGRSYTYRASDASNAFFKDGRSNMLGDVAMYYWKKDLAPLMANAITPTERNPAFWQHLVNYTVGLGTAGNVTPEEAQDITGPAPWPNANATIGNPEKSDDLLHAAANSRGQGMSATDAETFAARLQDILRDITSQTFSTAGAAVSGVTLTEGFAKYVPSYQSSVWTGDLAKFGINPNTGATIDNIPSTAPLDPIWSAEAQLPQASQRNIWIWKSHGAGNGAVQFNYDNLDASMRAEMGTSPFAPSASLIAYLRGDRTNEGTAAGEFRERSAVLGDIVNSTPLLVKNPLDFRYQFLGGTEGQAYRSFVTGLNNRTGVVFVGANDGMLHAFDDATGREVFAFIPRAALPNLSKLAGRPYDHRYFVDGPLMETHAYLGGRWKSLLLGSMGAGGRSIFALDVTSTASLTGSNVLWELNSTSAGALGHVTSTIEVGPVKVGDTLKWVALVGNGMNSTGNKAQLLVVDLADGSVLATLDTGVGSDDAGAHNGLGGVRAIRDSSGIIQAAYAGDLQGNVWRFNFSGGSVSSWGVAYNRSPLYTATDRGSPATRQPITAAPSVLLHPRGGVMVVVGTGKLLESTDRTGAGLSQVQTIYGIRDESEPNTSPTNGSGAQVAFSQLQQQRINTTAVASADGSSYYALQQPSTVDWNTKRGWYMDMNLAPGQRMIHPGQLYSGYAFVTTVVPASSGSCGTATGFVGLFDALNGTVNNKVLFDTNGDGTVGTGDVTSSWYVTEGDGPGSIIATPRQTTSPTDPPTPPNNRCGRGLQIVSASSNQTRCVGFDQLLGTRSWRKLTNPPR